MPTYLLFFFFTVNRWCKIGSKNYSKQSSGQSKARSHRFIVDRLNTQHGTGRQSSDPFTAEPSSWSVFVFVFFFFEKFFIIDFENFFAFSSDISLAGALLTLPTIHYTCKFACCGWQLQCKNVFEEKKQKLNPKGLWIDQAFDWIFFFFRSMEANIFGVWPTKMSLLPIGCQIHIKTLRSNVSRFKKKESIYWGLI